VASYRVAIPFQIYEMEEDGTLAAIPPNDAPLNLKTSICEALWSAGLAMLKSNADLTLLATMEDPDQEQEEVK